MITRIATVGQFVGRSYKLAFGPNYIQYRGAKTKSPLARMGASDTVVPVFQINKDLAYVEEDTERLVKYCCIGHIKDGADPEIKPDSEYPEWLFSMRVEPPLPLEQLDKESWEYWKRALELAKEYEQRDTTVKFSNVHCWHYTLHKNQARVK